MKKYLVRFGLIAIMATQLPACGTILSMTDEDRAVYGGVIRDFKTIQQGGVLSVLAVIDLPLSFVLDTLLLPVTLSQ